MSGQRDHWTVEDHLEGAPPEVGQGDHLRL
jgi:hypothetical protein